MKLKKYRRVESIVYWDDSDIFLLYCLCYQLGCLLTIRSLLECFPIKRSLLGCLPIIRSLLGCLLTIPSLALWMSFWFMVFAFHTFLMDLRKDRIIRIMMVFVWDTNINKSIFGNVFKLRCRFSWKWVHIFGPIESRSKTILECKRFLSEIQT